MKELKLMEKRRIPLKSTSAKLLPFPKLSLKPLSVGVLLSLGLVSACSHLPAPQVTHLTNEQIVKSPTDQRSYEYFVLDNGMKALVISDPDTDKAAAALDVHVGHMSDPKDRQGLAHYLEHMLFLGTEKYPEVGEYSKFIKKHGGGNNAGTGQQHTNYFFDIKPEYLEPALDRFAQFFVAPLFDPQYVQREKNAVHSEYKLKIKDEPRRIREVLKATTNSEHPASQFSVGNLDTLAEREGDPIMPDLKAFYEKHYSASRMSVTVIGKEPVSELKKYVTSKFSAVKNNGSKAQDVKVKPYTDEQLGVRINITPLKDQRTLSLQFPMPSANAYYQKKPLVFIGNLLRNEAKGSLYDTLKSKGLIESLSAYNYGPDDTDLFFIEFGLTKAGIKYIDEITDATFNYIEVIKKQGIQEKRFAERSKIANLNFQFKEKSSASSEASSLAGTMQYVEPQHILNNGYLYEDFDADLIQNYLKKFKPENLRQVVIAPNLETDKVEPLYQTPYSIKPLTEKQVSAWTKIDDLSNYQLPKENKFIAENPKVKAIEVEQDVPQLFADEDGFKFYYKQDADFKLPKSDVFVTIYSEKAGDNANNRAKMQLYTALLNDSLESYSYAASQAGLRYALWSGHSGLNYAVYGYNQKQDMLMQVLNKRIKNLSIEEDRFNVHKARLLRGWKNSKFGRPIGQTYGALSSALQNRVYSSDELLAGLKDVTIDDMKKFVQDFHKVGSVEVLAHGNVTKKDAGYLSGFLKDALMTGKTVKPRPANTVKKPTGENIIQLDIDHNDSSVVVMYQGENKSMELNAKYRLLRQVMSAPYYKSIRTDQQLGYVVGTAASETEKVPSMAFYVQSPKAGPAELVRRIDKFNKGFMDELKAMSDSDFASHKEGLINSIMQKENMMVNRSVRYSGELAEGYTNFDKREQLVAAINKLGKKDIIELLNTDILKDKNRIISRNFGKAHRDGDFDKSKKNASICDTPTCMESKLKKF